jgi:O-antigen ligase
LKVWWLIPFAILPFYPECVSGYRQPKLISLAILLGIFFAFLAVSKKADPIPIDLAGTLLVVFVLWAIIRYTGAASPIKDPFILPLLLPIFFIRKDLSAPLMWVTGAICAYAILQMFKIDIPIYRNPKSLWIGWAPDQRPFSFLGNPIFLGEYLSAILPLVISKFIWLAPVCIIVIVATGSRAAMLAMLAGIIYFLWCIRGKAMKKTAMIVTISLTVISLAFTPWIVQRVNNSNTVKGRMLWWTVTASMIADNPILGVGQNRFRDEYPGYQGRYFQDRPDSKLKPYVGLMWNGNSNATLESPHNQFLHFAAELGIPALILFLVILVLGIQKAPLVCSAGLVAMVVGGFFAFPLSNIWSLLLFGFFISQREVPMRFKIPVRMTAVIMVFICIISGIYYTRALISSTLVWRGMSSFLQQKYDRQLVLCDMAEGVGGKDALVYIDRARAYQVKGETRNAFFQLQHAQRGFDSPQLYDALSVTSGWIGFYQSKKAFYYPGVR